MPINIKDISLFKDLSESELVAVKACLIEKTFKKGETLFYEGKACERVFIIKTGKVRIYRISSQGREQVLETLEPGDTCACNPGSRTWSCSSSAEAITPCTVWFLSRDQYIRLVQTNTKISQALTRLFAERLQCFSTLIEDISLKDVKKRLIKFLLEMQESSPQKGGDPGVIFIPFTRQDIAQRIGTARETVARYLSQLKKARLIDIKPHQIIIRNKPALEKLIT